MADTTPGEQRLAALTDRIDPIEAAEVVAIEEELVAALQGPVAGPEQLPGAELLRIAARICAIHRHQPPRLNRRLALLCVADHGTGVGDPPEVGGWVGERVMAFVEGDDPAGRLYRSTGVRTQLLDVGASGDFGVQPGLTSRKVAWGTAPLLKGPAMGRHQAVDAILAGHDTLAELHETRSVDIVAVGALTGGDALPATLTAAGLLGLDVDTLVGEGGLLDEPLVWRVDEALNVHDIDVDDPLELLSAIGGFEIAAMAGVYLAAARHRVAAVVGGLPSATAALLACRLCPCVQDYLFLGHGSPHPLHSRVTERLGGTPVLQLRMDGTAGVGATVALGALTAAVALWDGG